MAEFSVLIIGAGTKGAFYDQPGTSAVLSHAHAFSKHPFRLAGFVDTDAQKLEMAQARWGGCTYGSIDSAFSDLGSIDLAVVSTPDWDHADTLKLLVGRPVKLIFAEKPFTRNLAVAKQLLDGFQAHGQTVAVNYTRRFSPDFMSLEWAIFAGELGNFLGGAGFYGKGLYHNGSHMVDLLSMLLGNVSVIRGFEGVQDGNPEDPSISALLECDGRPFYLGVLPRTLINAFEATLYFEKAAVRVTDCGRQIDVRYTIPRPDFQTEPVYGPAETFNSLSQPMVNAAQNIAQHLATGAPLLSPAENAIKVLEICEALA